MLLSAKKQKKFNEALQWAYNIDCSNGSGTYEQSIYIDLEGNTQKQIKTDIADDNVSFSDFVNKHIIHKS